MSFLKNNYLTIDLCFKNRDLERKYSESKSDYQKKFLYVVLLYGLLLGWGIEVNHKTNYGDTSVVMKVVFFFFLLLCAIVAWKRPNSSVKQITLLIIVFYLGYMEIPYKEKDQRVKILLFLTGINAELILSLTILAKISWKATSFISLLINTMNCFRYTDFEENSKTNFYPLIQFIQNSALISVSAYLFEKSDRESFYKNNNYEYYISKYNDLLRTLFPCAVIITTGQDILFHNKETLSLFECQYPEEVWDKLGTVKLENYIQRDKNNLIISSEEKSAFFENPNFTLRDVATAYRNNHELAQGNFKGEYEKVGIPKFLDIKVSEIFWENKDSLLIIFYENMIMEKMIIMREQVLFKNRLLAIVDHDLKTPLNGIIGIINMVLEINSEPQIRKYLKTVFRLCISFIFLINNIVDYTNLLYGGINLYKERFSLWECLLEVLDVFKFQIKVKNIIFEKHNLTKTNNQRAFIINDKAKIKQVIFNILGNAVKYTFLGYIKITLKELPQAFEISVEDTGIGIKPENQRNIFKLFGKLKDPENEDKGLARIGLGLPLSQSLVKALNNNREDGEIKMESTLDKGSRFSFLIFQDRLNYNEEEHQDVLESKTFEESKKFYNNPTMEKLNLILIIDSQRSNIESISNRLKTFFNFILDEAANSEEALRLIKIRASMNIFYTLILFDCDSDKFLGVQMANITKTLFGRQEIPAVPLVALSSNSAIHQNYWRELGLTDLIAKPLSNEVIKTKLEKYFIE